jgi:hypothetical protein
MVGRPLRKEPGGIGGKGKVIAPDDDPNFLRDISKMMKQEEEKKPEDDEDGKKDGEK